jgi:2',3'-cyclic-nucleotide 2'-phosphodiesterase (5'-nucleotidase family)
MRIIKLFIAFVLFIASACSTTLVPQRNAISQTKIDSNIKEDKAILAFYKKYKQTLDSQMNAVLVYSDVEMQKGNSETVLSNFFSDAIANTCKKKNINFDFAMPTTNGGIRSSLPKGPIKLQQAFELMPFENELVVLYLDGTAVKSLVQFIVDKGGQPISGIRIQAENSEIKNISINNLNFDVNKTYRVLTSDYLANGGDGINAFKETRKRENTGIKVRDAIVEYMKDVNAAGKTLNPTVDGRLQIK